MADLLHRELPARLNGHGQEIGKGNGHSAALSTRLVPMIQNAMPLLGVGRPSPNEDGDVEILGTTRALHRFVEAPGDSGTIAWHFVEAGEGEPVVLLHGLPGSWFTWHRQIDDLARDHRVLAIDLKGYGQSQKTPGDYRPEGVAEQLVALFDVLGLDRVNLVAHDQGAVVADYLGAAHPFRVRRYVRGQQHLYHFNESLAQQQKLFADPVRGQILRAPALLVAALFAERSHHPVPSEDLRRTAREWSYPGIGTAVARYFQASSARQEWVDRRTRLMSDWRFPVLVLQGEHDPRQPREFYEDIEGTMPDAVVGFVDAGQYFVFENPQQTTRVIRDFLLK
ncbi:MAG: alpha/beta hydrolase [Candidatus Binatia bacterium]|nr:alpha/beta hydrolase [Candidatus Binatia bacterium]